MKGALYIDDKDAYELYRLSVTCGSYAGLACLPKLKNVPQNDWHERNGVDPDLSSPVIDAHEFTLDFHIVGDISLYYGFITAISDGAYHLYSFSEISLTKRLRLVKCGNVKTIQQLHHFSLTFCDDNPMEGYEYEPAASILQPLYDYAIDGKDLSEYGIRILQGTYDSIVKMPDVKENLKVNLSSLNGQSYDGENVVYKSKSVNLNCLMRAGSIEEFWRNRNALLYDLIQPGARTLTVANLSKDIPFYYKSCRPQCFYPDEGKVWFEFVLTVEFFEGVI